jgi:hypothetical protein
MNPHAPDLYLVLRTGSLAFTLRVAAGFPVSLEPKPEPVGSNARTVPVKN